MKHDRDKILIKIFILAGLAAFYILFFLLATDNLKYQKLNTPISKYNIEPYFKDLVAVALPDRKGDVADEIKKIAEASNLTVQSVSLWIGSNKNSFDQILAKIKLSGDPERLVSFVNLIENNLRLMNLENLKQNGNFAEAIIALYYKKEPSEKNQIAAALLSEKIAIGSMEILHDERFRNRIPNPQSP